MFKSHIYVNMPEFSPNYDTIGEALAAITQQDGIDFSDTEAAFPAPSSSLEPVTVHIGEGTYRENLVISRPNLTFLGAGRDKSILVYGHYALEIMSDGDKRGTFRSASVRVSTHDFTAKHLTFQNDSGFGCQVGQALALYVDGDRNYFEDCTLLGSQDTLFTAPLPLTEAIPGGFKGPGEHKPRTMGRQYYKNCYIRGDVDFIFGSAIAYFEDCTIFSQKRSDRPEEPGKEVLHGYVTAASTPEEEPFGYVFLNCRLESNCPPHSVYLGRPWREWAKTVFLNCEMGAHIHPLGWNDWKKPHGHFYYGEYKSYGPGASPETRADFSHQLTDAEADAYTVENVLQGWRP